MSNRRSQFTLDLTAAGRQAELRVIQHKLNGHKLNGLTLNIIVVSIIIAVAIIPAQLADWIA